MIAIHNIDRFIDTFDYKVFLKVCKQLEQHYKPALLKKDDDITIEYNGSTFSQILFKVVRIYEPTNLVFINYETVKL